ncbi:MAG: transposase [Planctomycetota bacterium]
MPGAKPANLPARCSSPLRGFADAGTPTDEGRCLARPKPKGGRPGVADRACLAGIVFVLRTGAPWRYVPGELAESSGRWLTMTSINRTDDSRLPLRADVVCG